MKRFISATMAMLLILLLSGCGVARNISRIVGREVAGRTRPTSGNTEILNDDTDAPDDKQQDDQKKNDPKETGKKDDNKGNAGDNDSEFFLELTIPAELAKEMDVDDFEDSLGDSGYDFFKRNPDGSITYGITKEKQQELLDEYKKSLDELAKELIDNKDNSILDIKYNDDVSEILITVDPKKFNAIDRLSTLAFHSISAMYQMFNSMGGDMTEVDIKYVDQSGKEVEVDEEIDWNDLFGGLFPGD